MPSVVIGKVKGDKGDSGISPIVTLDKKDSVLSIKITDIEGTKEESINTQENVQADWNTTDTALDSYIKNKPVIPSKTSQLENDVGYLTEYTETDPTVPAWAKSATKPEYSAIEVGALPSNTTHLSGDVPITRKVNGKVLNSDITISASDVGADIYGSANNALEDAKTYTNTKIADLVNGAPTTLDTLKEIADAMETNKDVVDILEDSVGNKVDKIAGMGLSTNDYTTTEKNKLEGIAEGANKYSHPNTAGNKHIPSGGSSGQVLKWSANGTAVWGDETDSVSTATKATQDESGNNIKSSYGSSISVSGNNKLLLKSKSGTTLSTVDLSGIVSSGGTNTYVQSSEPPISTTAETIWIACQ